jgi:hypothetical protein
MKITPLRKSSTKIDSFEGGKLGQIVLPEIYMGVDE